MGHDATPEPGWYPDPTAGGHLRLWDGEGWTAQTRPWNPTPPAPTGTTRRRRMLVEGTGLGLMMLVAGFPALPSWGSPARPTISTGSVPGPSSNSAAAPSPSAPAPAPTVTVDCRLAASRPSPARVIEWFGTHGLASTPSAAPALPSGACGVAAFTDAHGSGTNLIVAYPNPQAANHAAATPPPPPAVQPLTFVSGIYVLALNPAVVGQRDRYQAELYSYVEASNPPVAVTPGVRPSRGSGRA